MTIYRLLYNFNDFLFSIIIVVTAYICAPKFVPHLDGENYYFVPYNVMDTFVYIYSDNMYYFVWWLYSDILDFLSI